MTTKRAADLVARMNALGGVTPPPAPAIAGAVSGDPVQRAEPVRPPNGAAAVRRSGGGRRRRSRAGNAAAVRYTVDLEPGLHRALHVWALDHQVDASEVVRTLVGLLDDQQVSEAVDRVLQDDGPPGQL